LRGDAPGRFGNSDLILERTHDMNILVWLETWVQDARLGLRQMRRAPGFTAIVVLSLALGIGANAAIFSLLNTVLIKTLSVPDPQQVYFLQSTDNINAPVDVFSWPVFTQMKTAARPLGELAAASVEQPLPLAQVGSPSLPLETQLVSDSYFSTLGITPLRGRWIGPGDNRALGASPVVVLSYAFWRRHFAGAAGILGQTITLRGVPLDVVGIAPPSFTGLNPAQPVDAWTPIMMQSALHPQGNRWSLNGDDAKPWPPQEGEMWLRVIARLSPGSGPGAIQAATTPLLQASFRRLRPQGSRMLDLRRVIAVPGGSGTDDLRKEYGAPLRALMVMVGLMLLIAVANVATLLLARTVRRRRELAIRLAIGIGQARLARQLLTEALLLSAVAALAAVAVAEWASRLMVRLAGNPFQPALDWRVWLALAAAATGVGLVLGVLPAWQARAGNPADAMKAGDSALQTGSRGRIPLGRCLVIAQVAFSLLLVAAAGLFSRSLAAMAHLNLGFDRNNLVTLQMRLPDTEIPSQELAVLDRRLLDRMQAIPGVQAVALDQSGLDNFSADTSGISLAGRPDPPGGLSSNEETVSRNFFAATGMTLVRGRGFDVSDTAAAPNAVVVNQAFARRFYSGANPVGTTFGYDAADTAKFHIVGEVADARVQDPHKPAAPLFYRLLDQSDNPALRLEVRTTGDPAAMEATLRQVAGKVDPRLTVRSVSTLDHRLNEMLQRDQLIAELSSGFGLLGLALACLGLYGVLSYAVAARRNEYSVRIALGARRDQVAGLVLREAAVLLVIGLVIGLPLALLAGRWLQPLLPGINASDPIAYAGAVALLLLLPAAAALHPAWRAARQEPAAALRAE